MTTTATRSPSPGLGIGNSSPGKSRRVTALIRSPTIVNDVAATLTGPHRGGGCYVTTFDGLLAEQRARDYFGTLKAGQLKVRRVARRTPHGDYRIVAVMPDRDGDRVYRIKSPLEEYERVVAENLLVKSEGHLPEDLPRRSRHRSITLPRLQI
jgi:hypothetical protein